MNHIILNKTVSKIAHFEWECSLFLFYILFYILPKRSRNRCALLIIGAFLLYFFWALIILTDRDRPIYLKNIVSVGLVILICLLFYRYSSAEWEKLGSVFFDLKIMARGDPVNRGTSRTNWEFMFLGLKKTLEIFVFATLFASVFGLLLAVLRAVVANDSVLNFLIVLYIDIFRALPMMVTLLILYAALPYTGIILNPEISGILTIGMVEAAYFSEIFRSGIEAIHRTQSEAARSLGLSSWQTMREVILPQAMRIVVPPYTGEVVGLLKSTSLLSAIAVFELLKSAMQIQAWYANPTPLMISAIGYMILLLPFTRISNMLEKKWKSKGSR